MQVTSATTISGYDGQPSVPELVRTAVPRWCPVTSCTTEFDAMQRLECALPSHHAFPMHSITVAVDGKGASPALPSANFTYGVDLRGSAPDGGSVAGGTLLTLAGDGFSERLGDIEVGLGGAACLVISANSSRISCVTGAAPGGSSGTVGLTLQVRGMAASGTARTFLYDDARTPTLTGAVVTSKTSSEWQYDLAGTGFELPVANNRVLVGETPCEVVSGSSTQLTCTSHPPLAGLQLVQLSNGDGAAVAASSLPKVEGSELSVESLNASSMVSVAGGAQIAISGSGFASADDTLVHVCEQECVVQQVSYREVRCSVPTLLTQNPHLEHLVLSDATAAEMDLAPPPPAPPGLSYGVADFRANTTLTVQQGKVVALSFSKDLDSTSLPRGATLSSVVVRVTPHSGMNGGVLLRVRVSVSCMGDPDPLEPYELLRSNETNQTVLWDVRPYGMGFEYDESPDLCLPRCSQPPTTTHALSMPSHQSDC